MNSVITLSENSITAFPARELTEISLMQRSIGSPFLSAAFMDKKSWISYSVSPNSKGMLLTMILFKSLPVTILESFSR